MNYLETKFEWKRYRAYFDKITFESKCGSNGVIKLSKSLKQFANFDFLYVKIWGTMKKFEITIGKDRGNLIYRSYIGYSNRKKDFLVYLKTTPKFKKIITKALKNSKDILENYKNPNFRIRINEDGILLLRFLLNISSKNKYIPRMLSGNVVQKSITLKTYKNLIREHRINSKLLSPFLSNRYIDEIKYTPIINGVKVDNPQIYRLIGMINGDGTLTKYGAYFYGNDQILHEDFKKISLSLDRDLDIKTTKSTPTLKTYWYSKKLATYLNQLGVIYNRKLNFMDIIKIDKNLLAYSEYLSGIYDTEGSIIKDSHIVIPTSVTVYNKDIRILDEKETKHLFRLGKEKGILTEFSASDSKYYRLGLNKLKKDKRGRNILIKLRNHFPGLALSNKKILEDLNINPKLELKNISIFPKSYILTATWWVKITLIKDVIKFAAIIEPHLDRKVEKLNRFLFNHITPEDFEIVRGIINKNGS